MDSRLDGRRHERGALSAVAALRRMSAAAWLRGVVALAVLGAPVAASRPAVADEAANKSFRGQALAKRGNCVAAVPLLEEAEPLHHRPAAALALADCYVALGELLKAAEVYRALADEKPARTHTYSDRIALRNARSRLTKIEQRIPTLAFELPETYQELEVYLNGERIDDPTVPRAVEPHVAVKIVARAKGRAELEESIELDEGARVVRTLRLEAKAEEKKKPAPPPVARNKPGHDRAWLGARFRSYLVPRAVMELFGDGGRTVLLPGGSLVYTLSTDPQIHLTLGYANYGLGSMPYKAKGAPDTDYEIVESTLEAAYATVEVMWSEPLDEHADMQFHYGFGVGIGWMFRGDLYRTQAYPPGMVPGDPSSYYKCDGPNRPPGSWQYCNSLDFDASHYNYPEPSWAQGGKRPLIYPWLAFPLVGFSARLGKDLVLDAETGVTDSGFLLGIGARAGL